MGAKRFVACCLAIFCAASAAVGQGRAPATEVSRTPLTEEQKAVYQAVLLESYGEKTPQVNLSARTVLMETSGPSGAEQCRKGMNLEPASTTIHRFRSADFASFKLKVVLSDPDRMERGRNTAFGRPSREAAMSLDNAPSSDYAQGISVLSEILFDKNHQHAIVSYRFECGELCGHGETIVLSKTKSGWKKSGGCEPWVR